ncbi:MAG TPA: hypothetical protein VL463_20895 [Kofleriaceae bacterium]|nr:hypothetical protein [Kofleriaceae bacterium]
MRLRPAFTPRDRLEHLLDYVRRAFRYWWVAAGLVAVGGALSVLYALKAPQVFQSQAVLVYQPKISSMVLSGREQETVQRNLGDRYRELLLSRKNLASIITDPKISPAPNAKSDDKIEEAIESLRLAIQFDSRGTNTFRITYSDPDKKRAQLVAAKLTDLLIQAETDLRRAAAQATLDLATQQYKTGEAELNKREKDYTEFLGKHPEFTQEDQPGGSEGAAIRQSMKDKTQQKVGNPRLLALERQADRIRAILATPEGMAPPPPPTPLPKVKTPEQIAAQQQIDEAQRELAQAKRRLEDARQKFTDKHPDVIKAQAEVTDAEDRLKRAISAMPADIDVPDPLQRVGTGPIDRDKLAKDLADLDKRIEAEKARTAGSAPTTDDAGKADAIVTLETQYKELRRLVDAKRADVQDLATAVSRAERSSEQQAAEDDANLTVVDPAYEPVSPHGKGKKFIVMVGLALFGGLGCAMALGLAILDDRLYRRGDVEKLDLAPVLAVIPRAKARRGRRA